MVDIDVNPFSNHNKMDAQPDETGKTIPLTPGGVEGEGTTWEPVREKSFGGMSIRGKVLR